MRGWSTFTCRSRKPTDVKGVEVTVTVLDPNGNCYDVAKATTDSRAFSAALLSRLFRASTL